MSLIDMKFVIEHLEEQLYEWCILEYKHISKIVGKDNLIFTNVKSDKLLDFGEVTKESVNDLDFKKVCVLDPFAEKELSCDDKFDYIVLGGILGDEPMQRRTEKEIKIKEAVSRNMGADQMSTDTAVYVAKHIIDGGKLSDIKFKDEIEIEIAEGESVILPFRYVLLDGKPMLPDGFVEFLKTREGF